MKKGLVLISLVVLAMVVVGCAPQEQTSATAQTKQGGMTPDGKKTENGAAMTPEK